MCILHSKKKVSSAIKKRGVIWREWARGSSWDKLVFWKDVVIYGRVEGGEALYRWAFKWASLILVWYIDELLKRKNI